MPTAVLPQGWGADSRKELEAEPQAYTGAAAAPAIAQQPQVTGPTEISDAATASDPGQPGASTHPLPTQLQHAGLCVTAISAYDSPLWSVA